MRFALISLSIYFVFHAVGTALADISGLAFPEFESEIESELNLEFSVPYSRFSKPYQLYGQNDPSNALRCDGYLTNNPAENFCSETVPNDWTAVEFNGELYYKVPLSLDTKLHANQ